jgi:hypothetical protein
VADLDKWKRLARKHLKAGDLMAFTFTAAAIPEDLYTTITTALADVRTVNDIDAVFAGVTSYAEPAIVTTSDVGNEMKMLLEAIKLGVEALKDG